MAQIVWNEEGQRTIELGVSHGFLYPIEGPGVPWGGLTKIIHTPTGGESVPSYCDGEKYLNETTLEELELSIEAFSYPEAFLVSNGIREVIPGVTASQQDRSPFSFSYRTLVEKQTNESNLSYKIHLVYDALALPPSIEHTTSSDAPQGLIFSWPLVLVHHDLPGYAPTMHISIDPEKVKFANLVEFEHLLYGENGQPPWLPTMKDIFDFFKYDLVALHIDENEEMGISMLTDEVPADLIGFLETGLYWRAGTSRLNETTTDGIYDLE